MTSKLTREKMLERARENVKALKMASHQRAFESAREEILADLQLAEYALARLEGVDSEPVAWTWHYREQWHVTNDKCRAEFVAKDGDVAVLPLYRHAQSAQISEPVLPLQDKDLQGVIDALEHPAGINAAGKQVVRHALVEIQERRKAERDSNPVGWTNEAELRDVEKDGCGYLFKANPITPHADPRRVIPLYRHAQPASEREQVRQEHAEWSQATFGNVGPVGPLKHLSKEALEAAAEPGDLSEWADMQFLLWDAQRRAGVTDEQITQAMIEKLAVNKQREWPEPKDGEPRLHIKEQPAPVVQEVDADDNFYSWFGREWRENYQHNQYTTAAKQMLGVMAESAWKAGRRAAMLQEFQKSAGAEATCRGSENAQVLNTKSPAQSDCCPAQNSVSPAQDGNSPATSDNWQVEAEKLAEMHGMSFVLFRHGEAPQCADPTKVVISFTDKGLGHDALPAAPKEVR